VLQEFDALLLAKILKPVHYHTILFERPGSLAPRLAVCEETLDGVLDRHDVLFRAAVLLDLAGKLNSPLPRGHF
jgi:hypothetical protein